METSRWSHAWVFFRRPATQHALFRSNTVVGFCPRVVSPLLRSPRICDVCNKMIFPGSTRWISLAQTRGQYVCCENCRYSDTTEACPHPLTPSVPVPVSLLSNGESRPLSKTFDNPLACWDSAQPTSEMASRHNPGCCCASPTSSREAFVRH